MNFKVLTFKARDIFSNDVLSYQNNAGNNILSYESACRGKRGVKNEKAFNLFGIARDELAGLNELLSKSFYLITDKENCKYYSEVLKDCFEISCNILYDRQILQEVIDKQKKYDIEYVSDFFKYVLRMFIRRYDESFVLTKTQCEDIKRLCVCLLGVDGDTDQYRQIIFRTSSKEIVECIKTIDLLKE